MKTEQVEAMFTPGPPCAQLMGARLLDHDSDRGWIRIAYEGKEEFLNPLGRIQGGFLASMLDGTMGLAILIHTGASLIPTTLDMNVSYLASTKPGPLVCEGEVLRKGKSVAFLSAHLMDSNGLVLVRATSTVMLVPYSAEQLVQYSS
jgi:uncharacterized protein (TIGR00369 family)